MNLIDVQDLHTVALELLPLEGLPPSQANSFMEFLDYAVTNCKVVDAVPVVHGEWEFGETMHHPWMKCSECNVSQSGWTSCFSFCPNCGAKMDGDTE